jgi:excisionase family DNA binding protein
MESRTIEQRLESIEKLLSAQKEVLSLDDVAHYTGLSKSYLYKLTHRREIPFSKPNGKTLYFPKKEIDAWLLRNRVRTNEEIESEAATRATLSKGRTA